MTDMIFSVKLQWSCGLFLPSELLHCWFGGGNGIRPMENANFATLQVGDLTWALQYIKKSFRWTAATHIISQNGFHIFVPVYIGCPQKLATEQVLFVVKWFVLTRSTPGGGATCRESFTPHRSAGRCLFFKTIASTVRSIINGSVTHRTDFHGLYSCFYRHLIPKQFFFLVFAPFNFRFYRMSAPLALAKKF